MADSPIDTNKLLEKINVKLNQQTERLNSLQESIIHDNHIIINLLYQVINPIDKESKKSTLMNAQDNNFNIIASDLENNHKKFKQSANNQISFYRIKRNCSSILQHKYFSFDDMNKSSFVDDEKK